MKKLHALVLSASLAAFALAGPIGCTTLNEMGASVGEFVSPTTPEAQIAYGANSVKASTELATTLLRSDRISSAQAKSYRTILKGGGDALDEMNATLVKCRASTASTPKTSPDPCKLQVVDVIRVALKGVADVKVALDAAAKK